MSRFARSAVELLYAAENALDRDGRRAVVAAAKTRHHSPGAVAAALTDLSDCAAPCGAAEVPQAEMLRQLGVAMREIADLRTMLAEEREARTQLLVSLGKRWKEEVVVELRSGDLELRRLVAELEGNVGDKIKDMSAQVQLLQQQVEDSKRQSRVYSSTRVDMEDRLRDEMEELKTKLGTATASCASTRIECVQMLEREKAAQAQRLDTELLRYAEMRRSDERALASAKTMLKDETARLQTTVRSLVQEHWREAAVALEKTLQEPVDALQKEFKAQRTAFRELDSRVESALHVQEAELRTTGNLLKERIGALESAEAVAASRVDRAERKCDVTLEAVSKIEGQLGVVRTDMDAAVAVSRRAAERAQQVESVQTDRDARLSRLESHLRSIATAEALKAEIEACRRQTSRVESHVEALRATSERSEGANERVARQLETLGAKVAQVERQSQSAEAALGAFKDDAAATGQRLVAVEGITELVKHAVDRQTLMCERVEQRVEAAESRHKVLSDNCDQLLKDVHHVQHTFSARIEGAQDLAVRCESASAMAKAEVDRIEKRVLKMEGVHSTLQASLQTAQSQVEDAAKEISALHRRQAQNQEWVSSREARLDQKLELIDNLAASTDAKIVKLEAKLQAQCSDTAQRTGEQMEELEARLKEMLKNMSHSVTSQLQEGQRRVLQQSQEDVAIVQAAVHDTQRSVERLAAQTNRDKAHFIHREHMQQLEDRVRDRESRLQSSMDEIRAAQHQYKEILRSMRTQQHQLQVAVQQTQGDLHQLAPVVTTHDQQVDDIHKSLRVVEQAIRRLEQHSKGLAAAVVAQQASQSRPEPASAPPLLPAAAPGLPLPPPVVQKSAESIPASTAPTQASPSLSFAAATGLEANGHAAPHGDALPAPSKTPPQEAAAPPGARPRPAGDSPAPQPAAAAAAAAAAVGFESRLAPEAAAGRFPSTASSVSADGSGEASPYAEERSASAILPPHTQQQPKAQPPASPPREVITAASAEEERSEPALDRTPVEDTRASPWTATGTGTQERQQANWFGSTSSSTASEHSTPEEYDEEMDESERLAASAERRRPSAAGDSPPQTLQSLIETASASGRSRSAASQRSARVGGEGGARPGASRWDDWDSTEEEPEEGGDDGDVDGEVDHIDVYHQPRTLDSSQEEESSEEDAVIPMEAVMSAPPRPGPSSATALFGDISNRQAAAAAATGGGVGTNFPRATEVAVHDDRHSEEDAVLPATGETSAPGFRGPEGHTSVRRSTVGARTSDSVSGSRASAGSTAHPTSTSSNSQPRQSGQQPPAGGLAPAAGLRKMYSNFDSSSDDEVHPICLLHPAVRRSPLRCGGRRFIHRENFPQENQKEGVTVCFKRASPLGEPTHTHKHMPRCRAVGKEPAPHQSGEQRPPHTRSEVTVSTVCGFHPQTPPSLYVRFGPNKDTDIALSIHLSLYICTFTIHLYLLFHPPQKYELLCIC
eukprot:gene12112-8336_t